MMCRSPRGLRPALALGLALLAAGPAYAQVGIYSPFYGNYGIPYGGFGTAGFTYGGLGYDGFGVGYGGFNGYGGLGATIGMYPWDQEIIKEQQYALNASQYNLQNAEAARAYQEAQYFRQQAINQARANAADAYGDAGYAPRYNVATMATRPYPTRGGARGRGRVNPALLPREKVLTEDGRILWPTTTPQGQEIDSMRQAVDTAFRDLVAAYRAHNRATLRDAIGAREKLYAFGNLAIEKLQADGRTADLPEFQLFLASLDQALGRMADAAPRAQPARIVPGNAPRSAGDVLRETVKDDANSTDRRPTAPGDIRPDAAPKSAGDVLRDTIERDRPAGDRPRPDAEPSRSTDRPPPPPRRNTETGGAVAPDRAP